MLRVSITLVAVIVCGCFAAPCSGGAQAAAADTAPKFAEEKIPDPALAGMTAFSVRIPSRWQFESAVLPAVDCNFASAVFRAYSRDGLTDLALLPMFTWRVTKGGSPAYAGGGDLCLHMDRELTAHEFLDRFTQTLDSPTIIGPMSIAPAYQKQFDAMLQNLASQNSGHVEDSKDPKDATVSFVSKVTGDVAAVKIETLNGTLRIEERLRAQVWCMHTTYAAK